MRASSVTISEKPLLRVLYGECLYPRPIWFMRQAGRYLPEYLKIRNKVGNFLDLCYTPELATEITLQPIKRFQLDAAILFSDILVIPHGLGQKVTFEKGQGPILEPIKDIKQINRLDRTRAEDHLNPVYRAIEYVRAGLPRKTSLIGFAGAPWTVAAYMIQGGGHSQFSDFISFSKSQPKELSVLIDKLTIATTNHLLKQIDAGVDVVQIFDSWCNIAADSLFDKFCVLPLKKIVSELKQKHPKLPIIGFPRGCGPRLIDYVDGSGLGAVSLDHLMSLGWANKTLSSNITIQGNLDPNLLFADDVRLGGGAKRIMDVLRGRPHIFNLGHGVHKDTDPERVKFLVEFVRAYE